MEAAAAEGGGGVERYRDGCYSVPGGLRLHFRDYPGSSDLPPLLCLHGLTRNARDFALVAERHSPRFRVIVLEFRGRGLSDYDPVPARYTPLTYAADVLQLLEQLQIAKAIFLGTSLGGLVTMTIAALAPQRIAATILNDIGPELDPAGLDRIQNYVGKDAQFDSWEDAARAIAVGQGVAFPNYAQADWLAMAQRNCRERQGAVHFDYDPAIALPFKTSGPTPKVDLWPLFAALAEKPLLVVRGEISDLLSREVARRMQDAAPDAEFVSVPGIGHAPELSEPEAVRALDSFLGRLAAG